MKGFTLLDQHVTGITEKPDPILRNPDDIIIKTTAVAPCTSDVHLIHTMFMPGMYGNFIGHEAVGIVQEVGAGVKDFKVGDRVSVPGIIPEFGSMIGQAGWPHFSENHSRTKRADMDGMFAEYIYSNRADEVIAHIPDEVTDIQAVMVSDMMGTAFAGLEYLDIQFGESVAILGIGPVGLMAVAGAVLKGAGRIFAVGSRKACFDVAVKYGATDLINYHEGGIAQQIMEKTGGKHVDKVLICGGDNATVKEAFQICRAGGGRIGNVVLSFEPEVPIPMMAGKEYSLITVHGGRLNNERMMELIKYGRIDPSLMVSHIYHGIDEIPVAFEVMSDKSNRDLIKPVVLLDK